MSIDEQIQKIVEKGKSIKIRYKNFDGDSSVRIVSNIQYNNSYIDDGFYNNHIKGYCHLRQEERTFKISRIISIEIL